MEDKRLDIELQDRLSGRSAPVEQTTRDSLNENSTEGLSLMANIRNETHAASSAETIKKAKRASPSQVIPMTVEDQAFYGHSQDTKSSFIGSESKPPKSIFSFLFPASFRNMPAGAAYRHTQMYGDLNVVQQRALETALQMDNSIKKQNAIVTKRMQDSERARVTKGIG